MCTYLWDTSDEYPEDLVLEYDREQSIDRFALKRGAPIPRSNVIVLRTRAAPKRLTPWDALENAAMVPLLTERALSILRATAIHDFQELPAKIIAGQTEITEYRVVNVTSVVNCADLDRSQYSRIQGSDRILKFSTLRHMPDCMGSHHIARDGQYLSHIVVSETLRERFVAAQIRGVRFRFPEECF